MFTTIYVCGLDDSLTTCLPKLTLKTSLQRMQPLNIGSQICREDVLFINIGTEFVVAD